MPSIENSGTFRLGDRTVHRLGYGAMQLAGPGVFGPPKDRAEAVAVLHAAIAAVNKRKLFVGICSKSGFNIRQCTLSHI